MNKALTWLSGCLAVTVIILAAALAKGRFTADGAAVFGTPLQAVLLDNGQVYYGIVSRLDTAYPEMTDVYYVVNEEDPRTRTVKHVLVKRGKELHAPTATYLNARHIVMIEPVGEGSEVAKLIAHSRTRISR